MQGFFKFAIAANAAVLAVVVAWILVPGGLYRPTLPVRSIEMKLVPIETRARTASDMDWHEEASPQFPGKDPIAPRWKIERDGSVRFFN